MSYSGTGVGEGVGVCKMVSLVVGSDTSEIAEVSTGVFFLHEETVGKRKETMRRSKIMEVCLRVFIMVTLVDLLA